MSRTNMNIPIWGGFARADEVIRGILIKEGYREIQYNLETVWKKGTGLATAMHYIKVEYRNDGTLLLSGWVQFGIGSIGGGEHDLEGVIALIPKQSVKKTMEKIIAATGQAPAPGPMPAGNSCGAMNTPARPSFCPNCGSALNEGAIFCGQCGNKLPL